MEMRGHDPDRAGLEVQVLNVLVFVHAHTVLLLYLYCDLYCDLYFYLYKLTQIGTRPVVQVALVLVLIQVLQLTQIGPVVHAANVLVLVLYFNCNLYCNRYCMVHVSNVTCTCAVPVLHVVLHLYFYLLTQIGLR